MALPAKAPLSEAPIQIGPLEVQALKEWPEIERLRSLNGELLAALRLADPLVLTMYARNPHVEQFEVALVAVSAALAKADAR